MLNKMNMLLVKAYLKVNGFLKDERGDVNVVAIVVLIGIAVTLAVLFKGQITNLLNSLISTITGKAENAVA